MSSKVLYLSIFNKKQKVISQKEYWDEFFLFIKKYMKFI